MAPPNAETPAPAAAGSGRQEFVQPGSERTLNNATLPKIQESPTRDGRLLALDFIGDTAEQLAVAAMAICAAAAAENIGALEIALRLARATMLEAIDEFRKVAPRSGPNPELIAEAAREYQRNRGGRS